MSYFLRTMDFDDPPFLAIPVFPNRCFRHPAIYINVNSGIRKPEDLAGKTVGEFAMYGHDAGVWPKGILSDDFGVKSEQCRWMPISPSKTRQTPKYGIFDGVGPQRRIDSLEGLHCAPSVPLNEEHSKERRAEFERELAKIAPNRNPKDKNWQAGRAPSQALRWAVDALCKAGTLSIIGV